MWGGIRYSSGGDTLQQWGGYATAGKQFRNAGPFYLYFELGDNVNNKLV